MNAPMLKTVVRAWLMEIVVSGFNFFVLMNNVYEPRWGVLRAHQIGMSTRIVYIFAFAYYLLWFVKEYRDEGPDPRRVALAWPDTLVRMGRQPRYRAPDRGDTHRLERLSRVHVALRPVGLSVIEPDCGHRSAPR